ncbi:MULTISPECIES: type II toxin-antitoxin system antitoxin SocA domain-containing protein [unclassified Clostridium]|uniref:type II toxin-antitoxin system antitoxin SocA domain-containing protein n=1 Tax=unclassified Clostridium TaxID=2614128 RepID=UPI0002972330|nr:MULTISPECIES: type II toxin-antitoxin system antitoxin SocA domain-containing protein [unclassified Clostridium]EKQ58236.1 MAG: putative phage-associated protein [Clostridium sp. Maddingley MBC34-26]
MRQLAFCEYCMNENEYIIHKKSKLSILNGEEISYIAKEAFCNTCNNEIFVSDVCDYNLNSLYDEYRKLHNIISVEAIKYIMFKYSINEEALSLLLGWKSNALRRYLEGDIPTVSNSDILNKIYDNANYYSIILQTNKERINIIDYNKSRQAVKKILDSVEIEEKLDKVIKYILIRCEDLTSSALQKLLYYVQGFYYMFMDDFIFAEDCEATADGPVYRSVAERYEKFGYKKINRDILDSEKLKLEDAERNIVESVIKFYGCYSGKILKQMTQNEAPWILSRTRDKNDVEDDNINVVIEKNLISVYFKGIKVKYNIMDLMDIQKYSIDLISKISM